MQFPWYQICSPEDNTLEQGDFIPDCPIVKPPANMEAGSELEVDIELINTIVLSQSCDLGHGKIEIVLVCPYLPLKDWLGRRPKNEHSKKAIRSAVKKLKRGHFPGYHLLNKENESMSHYQVVDFKNVYGINYEYLANFVSDIDERVWLLSPYKEHLSQAFARYFMRVGLPQDIRIEENEFWPLDS